MLNAKAQREMKLKARKGSPRRSRPGQKEIGALEDEFQQVQSEIRKNSPQYSALTQPQPLGLKEIQQQLDPETLLLEYSLGKSEVTLGGNAGFFEDFRVAEARRDRKVARQLSNRMARSVAKSLETPAQRRARIAEAIRSFKKRLVS